MKLTHTTALFGLCFGVLTYPAAAQGQKDKQADKPVAAEEERAPKSIAESVSRNLEYAEGDFLSIAEAMPEERYSFIPTAGTFGYYRGLGAMSRPVGAGNLLAAASFQPAWPKHAYSLIALQRHLETGKSTGNPTSLSRRLIRA